MQIKFLKSIVEHLTNKPSVAIVDLLVGKKDVNEFLIAKKLKLTINQTRNILYKLSDYGLVSFIRKKDKRKGWYIYFWTLNVAKSLDLLEKKLLEELRNIEAQLRNRKKKRYYACKTCNIEVSEEAALLNDFICPECEEVYELSDNEEIIKKLERDSSKLRKEIKVIAEERGGEEDKLEKKKIRRIKKAEKERKARRKKARKKAKRTRERKKKLEKKIKKVKKKVKKKIKKKLKKIKKAVKKKVKKKIKKKLKKIKKPVKKKIKKIKKAVKKKIKKVKKKKSKKKK